LVVIVNLIFAILLCSFFHPCNIHNVISFFACVL
jgi:hypothetical protein